MKNPYVGPRSFTVEESDRFFGREREARDLYSLVISERLVLFYAQSGAGKTSLLQTALAPELINNDFSVLPLCRVSGSLPEGVEDVDNIYVFNLMLSLDRHVADPNIFAHLSLTDFLKNLVSEDGETFSYDPKMAEAPLDDDDEDEEGAYVLILDQFEELLTTHHERWQDREGFFRQLNSAMRTDRNLSVVLSLREDFVASLDPYIPLMSNRLRDRYYMQRMEAEAALVAIRKPAELAGCSFADGVAEQLVDNLRAIKSNTNSDSQAESQRKGQYIEPVQLQVVCYQLWQKVYHSKKEEITAEDLKQKGDIDTALRDFYTQTIKEALQAFPMPESECRQWFDRQLITEAGTRGTVFKGDHQSAGIDNAIVEALADHYIIRAESRSGAIWYELVHDRFIDPILLANKEWLEERPLLRDAQNWLLTGKSNDSLLYQGQILDDSLQQNQRDQEPTVTLFLNASQKLQDQINKEKVARERERLANKKFRTWFKVASVVALLAIVTSGWAVVEKMKANAAIITAIEAKNSAESASLEATHNIGLALNEKAKQALKEDDYLLHKLYSYYALRNISSNLDEYTYHNIMNRVHLNQPQREVFTLLSANQHDAPITMLRFSTDGQRLVSASHDKTIRIWDAKRGQQLHQLSGHESIVTDVTFSPDGRQIASASWDKTVRLWDSQSGTLSHTLVGHKFTVSKVVYSPDGKVLASASWDNTIRLWDSSNGAQLHLLEGHTGRISDLRFSPDGAMLASASDDGSIRIWAGKTGKLLFQLEGHFDGVTGLSFSPDGKFLVSSSNDQTVIIWDLAKRDVIQTLEDFTTPIHLVTYSPDGKSLAFATTDHHIHLWDPATAKEHTILEGHEGEITALSFSPDGLQLVSSSKDTTIRLWRVSDGKQLHLLRGHTDEVQVVIFSPDGKSVASASNDKTIRLWNAKSGLQIHPFDRHSDVVTHMRFTPDGRYFATASDDNSIRLWDTLTGGIDRTFLGHRDVISSFAFSPDGTQLLTGSADNSVRLWDVQLGRQIAVLEGHQDSVNDVAFSADGKTIASTSSDKTIRLWDASTGALLQLLRGHEASVTQCRFSPNGTSLISASEDHTVRQWDLKDGNLLHTLTHKENSIINLQFSPDGSSIVTLDGDDFIYLWDALSGQLREKTKHLGVSRVGIFFDASGAVLSLPKVVDDALELGVFSPDARLFAATDEDHSIVIWRTSTGEQVRHLQGHRASITNLTFSPDGEFLVSSAKDKSVRMWSTELDRELQIIHNHADSPLELAFSHGGKQVMSINSKSSILTWDINSGDQLQQQQGDAFTIAAFSAGRKTTPALTQDQVVLHWKAPAREGLQALLNNAMTNKIAYSPAHNWIAVSADGNEIHLWNMRTGKEHRVLKGHEDLIERMTFSHNGKWLASSSLDHTVRIWNIATAKERQRLHSGASYVSDLVFSPDGRNLATVSKEHDVRVWSSNNGEEVYRLKGHSAFVNSVKFSPDGKLIATGSNDQTVRLWDSQNGQQIQLLHGHTAPVLAVAFSSDNTSLASGSEDGTIRIWPTSNEYKHEHLIVESSFDEVMAAYPYSLNILTLEYHEPNRSLYPAYSTVSEANHHELNYWLAAAAQGHHQAMFRLGLIYDRAHDHARALAWYKKARAAGSPRAATYVE